MKAKITFLFFFLLYNISLSGQSDLYPTREKDIKCNCEGDGIQPYTERYNKFTHYQIAKGEGIITIAQFCNYIEFSPFYKVAADGGSSFIKIFAPCVFGGEPFAFFDQPGYDLNEFAQGDFDRYGKLSVEFRSGGNLLLKYDHPKIPPPAGVKSITVYPNLGLLSGEIEIFHPPVAMIHGLWADRSSFEAMEENLKASAQYSPWQLHRISYKNSNDKGFNYNASVVQTGIDQLLAQCWDRNMAVKKVNVVGHSMGGLLTRAFVQDPNYLNEKSVNKIITCNTPHQGSQMANWLLDNTSYGGTAAATALQLIGMNSYNGAVANLRVNSLQIANIQTGTPQDPVYLHTINTVQPHIKGPPQPFFVTSAFAQMLFQIASTCGGLYLTDIFDSPDSDIVVALESQVGGLSGLNTELYNNQIHVGSVANAQVIAAVLANLSLPNTDPAFANQFNAQTLNYSIGATCLFNEKPPKRDARLKAPVLMISAPTAGQNVEAGSNLTITFSSAEIDSVIAYVPHTKQNFAIKKVKSTENTFTLPTDIALMGPVELVLMGYSATNELLASATMTYNQSTTAVLNSIYTYPSIVYLKTGDSLAVDIIGKFSDNIDRGITQTDLFTFSFKNNSASRVGTTIILNTNANDTLTVSYNNPGARVAIAPIQLIVNSLSIIQLPLPVQLLSFTGKATEKGNLLEWKTAQEMNFSHFEVERSKNGMGFEKIRMIQGNKVESYSFLDEPQSTNNNLQTANAYHLTSNIKHLNYYRLKLIDLDGKFSYSKIIFIKNEQETEVSISPNPFTDHLKIVNSQALNLKIRLLGITGNQIANEIQSSATTINFPVKNTPAGLYFLEINNGVKVKVLKVIKEN
jgi:pimeloyl-ACP methyl ester carboxylesterase